MKLILGGDGFIGRNLVGDMKVGRSILDLTNYQKLFELLKYHKPETVINCAGLHTSFVSSSNYEHSQALFRNLRIDMNLLEAAKNLSIPNVLLISSTTAFSTRFSGLEMTEEEFISGGEVDNRFFGYAQSKRIQVELCKSVQLDTGLNYKSAVLGNIYGPYNHLAKNSTAVASIFYQVSLAIQNQETSVRFFGNGLMKRNWTYVEDLNEIFDRLILNTNIKSPVIVSSMEICDLRTIASLVKNYMGYQGEIQFDNESVHNPVEDKLVNNSKLLEHIGNFSFTKIERGIEKTALNLLGSIQ